VEKRDRHTQTKGGENHTAATAVGVNKEIPPRHVDDNTLQYMK